jgi:hypothetical protein
MKVSKMEPRSLAPVQSISIMPTESEWAMLKEQALMVVKTGLLPKTIDTPEKAIAIALKGRELGVPPMQAFSQIHIVDGKPGLSAELMLALIYRNCPRAVFNYLETTDKICKVEVTRPGHKPTIFSYSIEEAQKAGLLGKSNWSKYPAAMLRARAIALASRAVFPDAIVGGSHTPEELGAEVNEDGEVIDIPKTQTPQPAPLPPAVESNDVRGRAELGNAIMAAVKVLKLTPEEMNEWVAECSGGRTTKEMTTDQMADFLDQLEREKTLKGLPHE